MKLGVLIPVFNSQSTIEETLQSVLKQSVLPYEICIVDDGSTDNSEAIIHKYAHEDNSILWKIIHQENKGLGAARNAGIEVMTSDYIAFLDADDKWTTDKVKDVTEFLENQPQTDILYHPIWEWSPENGRMRRRRDYPLESIQDIWLHNPLTPSATVIRKDAMKWEFDTDAKIHGVEDALLWSEAMHNQLTFRRMAKVDTMYRINHGMTSDWKKHEDHVQNALNKAIDKGWVDSGIVNFISKKRAYHTARVCHKAGAYKDARSAYGRSKWTLKVAGLSFLALLRINY